MPLASQLELPERYRVARHIASGGMASVWEAEDLMLGRTVAVKVLAPEYAADPAARARFQREARTAAQVSDQSHVVTIYDIGEHENDAFIVMEYFAGGTVADRLKAAREAGEPIAHETALRWLREAAAGLDVAHAAGIVHRDVKPANLLLDAQGRVAVGDFGIARLADDTQMTQTGQVLGTAAYISPEQACGEPASAASDRYSLAVVAYELLTGSRPFRGGPPTAQAMAHAQAQPPKASQAAPGLPRALDPVLARGLAKDPAERSQTATELVEGIARALDGASVEEPTAPQAPQPVATPARPAEPARAIKPQPPRAPDAAHRQDAASAPPERRRISPGLAGAGLLAAAAIALVLVLSGGGDPQRSADRGGEKSDQPSRERARTTTTDSGAQQNPPPASPEPAPKPKPAGSGGESPSRLAARGHDLVSQKRYGDAVAPLQAAVDGYKAAGENGLPYAYALYDLGVALNRSGNPSAAIPLLEERLKFNNQTETVMAELRNARARAGKGKKADDGGD